MVLEADWSVDAGRQFDRTAEIWIGGTNVYFGTTAEPSHDVMRSWHTESNLTDYTPLFTSPQGGRVDCDNLVNETYTSHIHGSATIQFYPLAQGQNPPQTANVVLPMAADSTGGTVTLNTPSDQLAGTFTMPTNVERAYLDVFAQSQSGDEFWYTCAPNDVAGELENCGSTAFREAEVSIDGTACRSCACLSVDLHRRNRSLPVASDSRRAYAQLRTVSRRPHAIRRRAERRPAAHRGGQRLQRQRILLRHRDAAALSGLRLHPGDRSGNPEHHWPAQSR